MDFTYRPRSLRVTTLNDMPFFGYADSRDLKGQGYVGGSIGHRKIKACNHPHHCEKYASCELCEEQDCTWK